MKYYYSKQKELSSFTGRSWSTRIIEFILELHIEEWYLRRMSIKSFLVNFGDKIISLGKRSLIMTIRKLACRTKEMVLKSRY